MAKVEVKHERLNTETGVYESVASLDDVRKLRVEQEYDSRTNTHTVFIRDTNEYV